MKLESGPHGQRKRRRTSESDVELVEVEDVPNAKRARREKHKAVSFSLRCAIYRIVAAVYADQFPPHVFGPNSSSLS